MNKLVIVFVVSCLQCFTLAWAEDEEECKKLYVQILKKKKEIVDRGDGPACMKELGLDKFLCGGDPEKAKELMPQRKEFLSSKSNEEKKEIKHCFKALGEYTRDEMELGDKCKDEIIKILKDMRKSSSE